MKKRLKRIAIVAVSLIIVCLGAIYFYCPLRVAALQKQKDYKEGTPADIKETLTVKEVGEDVRQIIQLIESSHPIFLEGENLDYEAAKSKLVEETKRSMGVGELQVAINKYLSSIQDGHTQLYWNEQAYLDAKWRYVEGKLLLTLISGESNGKEVVVEEIGGVAVSEVEKVIKELFAAENYVAENRNIEKYSKYRTVLKLAGVKDVNQEQIKLKIKENSSQKEISIRWCSYLKEHERSNEVSAKQIEDVFYIKMGVCRVDFAIKDIALKLEQAIKEGTKKVVIDVRNNPGGSSDACSMLLEAMGMRAGDYGCTLRYSQLAKESRGYIRSGGSWECKPNNEKAKPNDRVELYVLTDEETFSSATMLAVWVQDGKLGKIAGQASSNMPSAYGDVMSFCLTNSKLQGQVSHKKFLRPDASKNEERTLEPDVFIKEGEDTLQEVMDLLAK